MRIGFARVLASVVAVSLAFAQARVVFAQPAADASVAAATISGTIVDLATSLPVGNADVVLYGGDVRTGETRTANDGTFTFTKQKPAAYHIEVRATGYISGRSETVFVAPGAATATLAVTLQRSSEASSTLREIGRVGASTSNNQTLQTSSTITQEISTERLERENYARIADALQTLPGVNVRGLDSSVGDDIYVDIRGVKSSETQTLLDGHPIGPIGVFGNFGGSNQNNSYNFQASPFFALRNVEVTYGAGALSTLYNASGIGGTVDLQTLNPTKNAESTFLQGFGNQGKATTSFTTSGTVLNDKLGYVLSHGVQGTYGQFKPATRFQTAFLGQDQSTAGIDASGAVYPTSANYLLRQDLLKLQYRFSNATQFQYTQFLSSSYDDKTGNGDNDSTPFDTRLSQVLGQLKTLNVFNSPPDAMGNTTPLFTCPSGQVAVKSNAGFGCESPSLFAQQTSGPNGGGSNRFQTILNQDYHGRLTTTLGNQSINVDSYVDRFQTNTARSANIDSNFATTYGVLVADDLAFGQNSFGFGFDNLHQRLDGDSNNQANPALVPKPRLGQDQLAIFTRGSFTPFKALTLVGNLSLKSTNVVPQANFVDPRLTATFRASANDVIRVSGARTQGQPSILLLQGAPSFGSPGSTTYICGGLTGVGSAPGTNLLPEDSKEFDLTYGHRFYQDSQVQIAFYNANIANELLSGTVPIGSIAGLANSNDFLGNYQDSNGNPGYASTLASRCNLPASQISPANFGVSTTANVASLKAQGIEISGRARVNPRLFFDYSLDEQQTQAFGLSQSFLQNNLTYINGGQVPAVPRQKASLAVDVNDGRGLEVRVDGFYTGNNNYLNGPPYTQFNGSITKSIPKSKTTLNFGLQNIFNVNTGAYGAFGGQVFQPENQYGTDRTPFDQFNTFGGERFFLPPRTFNFTLTQKV